MDKIEELTLRVGILDQAYQFAASRERDNGHKFQLAKAVWEESDFHKMVALEALQKAEQQLSRMKQDRDEGKEFWVPVAGTEIEVMEDDGIQWKRAISEGKITHDKRLLARLFALGIASDSAIDWKYWRPVTPYDASQL